MQKVEQKSALFKHNTARSSLAHSGAFRRSVAQFGAIEIGVARRSMAQYGAVWRSVARWSNSLPALDKKFENISLMQMSKCHPAIN